MKVYIVTEIRSEDYHGSYETVISVHLNKETAESEKYKLYEDNNDCNIEYDINVYNVIV